MSAIRLEQCVLENLEVDDPPVAVSSSLAIYLNDKATVDTSKTLNDGGL
jgi:hypothetical protein